MKKIILLIVAFIGMTGGVFAGNNIDLNKTVFHFPSGNYYYMSDPDIYGFVDGSYSIEEAMINESEFGKIFNSLFPEDSCYISDCGINKKKLLFEAILKYNYEKTSELKNEIDIAKSRYSNQSELNNDLDEIDNKVSILINNMNSHKESWYDIGHENQGIQICNTNIENGIIKYNFKRRFIGTNSNDIFSGKYYLLALALNIDTGSNSDSMTINEFNGKNNVFEINSVSDIEKISSISVFKEINIEKTDNNYFSLNLDYLNIENQLEDTLSKIFDTYNNQKLNVYNFRVLLFYENSDGSLSYISDIKPSYDKNNQSFAKSCKNIYKVNNEESFNMEVYKGGVNDIVKTENNTLFVKKIDSIFDKLDRKYDFWNLDSKLNKKSYYLILNKLKKQIDKINISFNEKIKYYNNQDYSYVVQNKEQMEKFFERKMFIDYIERKIDFRIEEGLIEYYEMKSDFISK